MLGHTLFSATFKNSILATYGPSLTTMKHLLHLTNKMQNSMVMAHSCLATLLPLPRHKGNPAVSCSYFIIATVLILCKAYWHRTSDGKLACGTLLKWDHNCKAKFDIYVPEDLPACPKVVVICRHPHSHPPPAPVKTPPSLVDLFRSLLVDMDWQLADATPRRIVLHSGFMRGLRTSLGWVSDQSPCLSDLHPSLANLDHVRRLIDVFRLEKYPLGTGFEGDLRFCIIT
jgi:hypothetical protein